MAPVPSKSLSVYQDNLTGLTTIQGWINTLEHGNFPAAGSLIALEVTNIGAVSQTYNHLAGDTLLRQIVARMRLALPEETELIHGASNIVFAWLPHLAGIQVDAFVSHLRVMICTHPVVLPGNIRLYPRLNLASLPVEEGISICDTVQALERELQQQLDITTPGVRISRATSTRDELDNRLQAVRLYGRKGLLECMLAALRLPSPQPHTILLLGPPEADKAQLLAGIGQVFISQQLPLAEVYCRPSDQRAPLSLVTALIYRFLAAYPRTHVQQRLKALCQREPWLVGLFPSLRNGVAPAPLPADETELNESLQRLLLELAHTIPHIAVVHSLHLADDESLAVLAEVQATPGHGLRIIAGADAGAGETSAPTRLGALAAQRTTVQAITPFAEDEVAGYIRELLGSAAQPEMAASLYQASNGWPVAIANTLRSWVENGLLTFQHGEWIYHPAAQTASVDFGLNPVDTRRLAIAALLGPASIGLLAKLWRTEEDDALATVERGRALGFLKQPENEQPETVDVADPIQGEALLASLTHEQRVAARMAIEQMQHAVRQGEARPTALAAPVEPPQAPPQSREPNAGAPAWEEHDEITLGPEDLPLIVHVVKAVRLAGMQAQLYPPESKLARTAAEDAEKALNEILMLVPAAVITFDGQTLAFCGQLLTQHELRVATSDLHKWLAAYDVQSISFLRGVTSDEVARLFRLLVTPLPSDSTEPVRDRFAALQLRTIEVVTVSTMGIPSTSGADDDPPPAFLLDALGITRETTRIESEVWLKTCLLVEHTPLAPRRKFYTDLARWLRNLKQVPSFLDGIEVMLICALLQEQEPRALHETAICVEIRLEQLLAIGEDWEAILDLLEAINERFIRDPEGPVPKQLHPVLTRISANTALHNLLLHATDNPQWVAQGRRVAEILGKHLLQALVPRLRTAPLMPERVQIVQLLRAYGDIDPALLLQELRDRNPWFVYRNLLQVMAEIGNEEALGIISERLRHEDPRVRAEAIVAATRIARDKAAPYLMVALNDDDPLVLSRAASVAGLCPKPEILDQLYWLLLGKRLEREEEESVQLATCMALGQFTTDAARDLLLEILYPHIFSAFRSKSDGIRSAAVVALAQHAGHPGVQAALQQATRDRSSVVRQTALRIWQQHVTLQEADPVA